MWIVWLLVGFVTGSVMTRVLYSIRTAHGVLKIDRKYSEKEKYLFDIHDLDVLARRKRIVLKIDNDADLSQN